MIICPLFTSLVYAKVTPSPSLSLNTLLEFSYCMLNDVTSQSLPDKGTDKFFFTTDPHQPVESLKFFFCCWLATLGWVNEILCAI